MNRKLTSEEIHQLATAPLPTFNIVTNIHSTHQTSSYKDVTHILAKANQDIDYSNITIKN